MHRMTRTLAALLAAIPAAACADLTSGGVGGRTETYLAGDEPTTASSAHGAPADPSAPPSGASFREAYAIAVVDASVTVGVQVFLDGGPEGSVELTSGVQTQTVPAQGTAAVRIADQTVAAGLYTRGRVVFTRVEADVRSGLVVGGIPIVGIVRVSASAQDPIVVERSLQVEVREDATAQVLVDLNAPVWLAGASPVGNVVSRTVFAGAVELRPR
jgi:hypothetical protein